MPDPKILIITANTAMAAAAERSFAAARVHLTAIPCCQQFPAQTSPGFTLVLLDLACLGPDKIAKLKDFLAKTRGLAVIAMFEASRTPDRTIVEILSAGADDAMPNTTEMPLLVAKTRSHLRRLVAEGQSAEHDAQNLNSGSGI